MKSRKSILISVMAASLLVMTACGNKQEQAQSSQEGHMGHEQAASPGTEKAEMQSVGLSDEQVEKTINSYLKIKDALVETDSESAGDEATNLVAFIGENADGLAGKIRSSANAIARASDVGEQRNHFEALSNSVYTLAKQSNAHGETLYRQYCPMAMNNNGAYWLSSNEQIRNPYFGDKMLKCGSVKETLN